MTTVTVCTTEFAPLAQMEARALGMERLPMVLIPHPLGGLRPEDVREKADKSVSDIIQALTVGEVSKVEPGRPKGALKHKPLFAR